MVQEPLPASVFACRFQGAAEGDPAALYPRGLHYGRGAGSLGDRSSRPGRVSCRSSKRRCMRAKTALPSSLLCHHWPSEGTRPASAVSPLMGRTQVVCAEGSSSGRRGWALHRGSRSGHGILPALPCFAHVTQPRARGSQDEVQTFDSRVRCPVSSSFCRVLAAPPHGFMFNNLADWWSPPPVAGGRQSVLISQVPKCRARAALSAVGSLGGLGLETQSQQAPSQLRLRLIRSDFRLPRLAISCFPGNWVFFFKIYLWE